MAPARSAAQVWAAMWSRQALPEESSLNVIFIQASPISTDKVVIYRSNTKALWHFQYHLCHGGCSLMCRMWSPWLSVHASGEMLETSLYYPAPRDHGRWWQWWCFHPLQAVLRSNGEHSSWRTLWLWKCKVFRITCWNRMDKWVCFPLIFYIILIRNMILRHDLQNQGQRTPCLQMAFNDCHKNNRQLMQFTAGSRIVETAKSCLLGFRGCCQTVRGV